VTLKSTGAARRDALVLIMGQGPPGGSGAVYTEGLVTPACA
jgi:hypothetical protein